MIEDRNRAEARRRSWVLAYRTLGDAGAVCRRFGISRPTLRKWLRRYEREGEFGLRARSRRPHRSPTLKVGASQEALILGLRRERRLGVTRLRNELQRLHDVRLSTATIHIISRVTRSTSCQPAAAVMAHTAEEPQGNGSEGLGRGGRGQRVGAVGSPVAPGRHRPTGACGSRRNTRHGHEQGSHAGQAARYMSAPARPDTNGNIRYQGFDPKSHMIHRSATMTTATPMEMRMTRPMIFPGLIATSLVPAEAPLHCPRLSRRARHSSPRRSQRSRLWRRDRDSTTAGSSPACLMWRKTCP